MSGKGEMYPPGLFKLKEDTAEKLARSLAQVNDSIPKVAEISGKYVAPVMLLSTFLTDLAVKGMVLYGIIKAPTPSK